MDPAAAKAVQMLDMLAEFFRRKSTESKETFTTRMGTAALSMRCIRSAPGTNPRSAAS